MGRVRVVFNHCPETIRKLDRNVDRAVDNTARTMAGDIAQKVWYRYGYVQDATVARTRGDNHAEVWCGFNRSTGFYSRFNEWGTIYQQARPIVGPTAHAYETIYAKAMADAVRDACNMKDLANA